MPFLDKFKDRGTHRPPPDAAVEPVVRNLESILNTKSDYGYFRREFGIGEYLARTGTSEMVEVLTGEIEHAVSTLEPRIREPELIPRGRDAGLILIYDLKCILFAERRTLRIRFDTMTARVQVEALPPP